MGFCPAFWDWLLKSNRKCTLFSIEKIKHELKAEQVRFILKPLIQELNATLKIKKNLVKVKFSSKISHIKKKITFESIGKYCENKLSNCKHAFCGRASLQPPLASKPNLFEVLFSQYFNRLFSSLYPKISWVQP